MRDDISEMKELIKGFPALFATKVELAALDTRIKNLERRNGIKTTLLWVGLVASAIINIIGAYRLFDGPK
ncbi:hypothetical protein KRR55_06010 [Paeniglutamicibacter sp. ABSL32-1]|uniref:hypothetical protein n=1 Tax=Paeniglutamicibacter quisquiliarum TaxID=2849498 RepID=UPI001C2CCA8E|nr:hypothetical protein [Paeniglutamicibacter quisquiliarum]MBV1778666.1 hypothetical protein [Paeniglutamicibacter quisquiliarum]